MIYKKIGIAALASLGANFLIYLTALLTGFITGDFITGTSLEDIAFLLFYISLFIFAIGTPVSILAYYIVRNKGESRRTLNFSIHMLSSTAAGLIFFHEIYPLVIITVLSGFLFFLGDEWVLYRKSLKSGRFRVWKAAAAAGIIACTAAPIYLLSEDESAEVAETVDLSKPPVISVEWNETTLSRIKPEYCKFKRKDCTRDKEPYYINDVKGEAIDIYYANTFRLNMSNRLEDPEYEIYYLEGEQVKQLESVNGIFVIPDGLKDQIIKGNAVWENEILQFEAAVNMVDGSPAK
ncbi:hypothetical protein [Metabacillus idriensis]|uniref:hypothetical protein n=1 Tax=Metabacillus idriensis TaxID=324768 RepID=UPI003D2952C9